MPSSSRGRTWLLGAALLVLLGVGYLAGRLLAPPSGPPTPSPATMLAEPEKIPDQVVVSAGAQRPDTTPDLLPASATALHVFYRFERQPAALPLTLEWRLSNGAPQTVPASEDHRDRNAFLSGYFLLAPATPAGFAPGIYQLTFRNGPEVVAEASFVVAADAAKTLAQQPPPAGETRVVSLLTCAGLNPQGQPLGVATAFPPAGKLYALFTYLNGVNSARFAVRWLAEGEEIPQAGSSVEMNSGAGQGYAWLQAAPPGLPEGRYQVQVLLAGSKQPLATADFTVSAAAPPPSLAPPGAPAAPPVSP
ncbi:MAG TPA: hypothetical protein VGM19_06825 [Armatimonadota bacterium]|jgi:hypothetical protein